MRAPRIKIDPRVAASVAHLMSLTINGERCFSREEKEMFWLIVRRAADFCGIDLYTLALMASHPHLLARIPFWGRDPDDEELLRRYKVLNPHKAKYVEVIAAHLAANTETGIEWRRRQLAQMGDFSQFMKIVKQRFVAWYNRRHHRTGTIWAGRFKSVLVEENSGALLAMAAYIDLNPVRAGIVSDPKDYRFSGYGRAVAGDELSRQGIMQLMDAPSWEIAQAEYRTRLYAVGAIPRSKGRVIPIEEFDRVVADEGKLSLPQTLNCRIRGFTDGLVLGTREFVAAHLAKMLQQGHRKRRSFPRPLPPATDWGGLATLRALRRR